MFDKINTYLILIVLVMGITSCKSSRNIISKNINTNWQFKAVQDSVWLKASVPGTVHTDLLANGVIEDPFYRLNEKQLQWIDKTDWEYYTTFKVDNKVFNKETIELEFKGLDTYAKIYINDSLVFGTDNMFVGYQLNSKPFLKLGENQLKIVFDSPIRLGLEKRDALGYRLPNAVNDQSVNGGLGDKQVAVFSRKAGYHFGWDWGPRLVSSGIWQDILLLAWNKASIKDVYIKQTELTNDVAQLNVAVELEATDDFKSFLNIKIDSVLSVRHKMDLKKGINKIEIPVIIENPELWWTNGLGNQKLYKIDIEVTKGGRLLASNSKNIGLKTLEVVQQPDSIGTSFYFKLNGHPVFMKGANYIPQDVFLNRVTIQDYERIIQDMVYANYNMIRVWGGGIYEKDIFYELCDKNGILVWQDFMFACAMYPGDAAFLESVKQEAIYNVKRLRNHTSIALWCGNNENLVGWKNWGWINDIYNNQGGEVLNKVWKGYTDVFHNILPDLVKELDSDTFYWASSPSSVQGEDQTLTSGDYHYWKVWGQQAAFSTFNEYVPRFMSEYGFQSFPEFETVKKYTLEEDWDIYSEVMQSHQRSIIGNKNIEFYMESMYRKPKDFQSFLYVSQLLQAKGMQIAIEAHRRNMPYCMGSLYWQINDCWPVASWSSIDYYGNWKASHFKVKELYKPIKSLFFVKDNQLQVHIVSDELENKSAKLNLKLLNFNGELLNSLEKEIDIKLNTSAIYFSENLNQIVSKYNKSNILIVAELLDDNTHVFDESIFFFETEKKLELTQPTFNYTISKAANGKFVVEIVSNVLAKDVRISSTTEGKFSINYFDMLPFKKYRVYFDSETEITDEKSLENFKINSLFDTY
ncbi:glycoside hydrolase family 2 protein [Mariniflexile aquimaris]|uniref:Beta-mannosidase B n=1 Tax=Mariniflexile aquimaris TaxID=881009 RepID=A0ABW3BTG1_9FLAO